MLAHRASYMRHVGPIPAGENHGATCVLHKGDNPRCVNPEHLMLGTHKANMQDMARKGRAAGRRGQENVKAKLTEDQVREIRVRYAAEGIYQKDLAEQYGVQQAVVGKIVLRQLWKHVE